MARLTYFLVDSDGYLTGEGFMDRADWDKVKLCSHVAAVNSQYRLVDTSDPAAPAKPQRRPDPLMPKRERLEQLQAKGWITLSTSERDEARGLAFDLGQWAPG